MTFFDWMRELHRLATFHGYDDLVMADYGHLDQYLDGLTPSRELARLIEQEEKQNGIRS